MTFQPRIPANGVPAIDLTVEFQLGHDFSAMDTVVSGQYQVNGTFGFQLGHDFSVMDTPSYDDEDEYKEAFQWGHDFSAMDTWYLIRLLYREVAVSMGP